MFAGGYLHADASYGLPKNFTVILSPLVSVSSGQVLLFYMFMYGKDVGEMLKLPYFSFAYHDAIC